MKFVTAIIIGAGQAGLAMSKHLADRSIDHVLLERGTVAHSWKNERWNSLRLLTPNWQSRLPGYAYAGNKPDGFMDMQQVSTYLDTYATTISAPVQENTTVVSVYRKFGRYIVATNQDTWMCSKLVLASGACNLARIPAVSNALPKSIFQISPLDYKSPDQLDDGGVLVVGASATGMQLAREIQASGRQVMVSAGEHIRVPRSYRGRDIKWWMDATGILDEHYRNVDDIVRARKLSSLQLAGCDDDSMLDINALSNKGIEFVGRLAGLRDDRAQFSGSLANMCSLADLKMNRLLEGIDSWAQANGVADTLLPSHRFAQTMVSNKPRLDLNLTDGTIKTVIWATGFRPDYSWLDIPVIDRRGNIKHDGGIVDSSGMYVLGLPFMRKRKSTLIDGVGDDAQYLAGHLTSSLTRMAA